MLSITVITYNEQDYLPALLNSLTRQTLQDFEIVLVDSASTDRTRQIAESWRGRFRSFQIVDLDRPRGPAHARNRGAAHASHERLLFLDSDSVLAPDFLERALDRLERRRIDVATCFIRINEASLLSRLGAFVLNAGMILMRPVYITAYGACLFSTREAHAALGGFNERLGICEDCDYARRACETGRRFRTLWLTFGTSDRRARSEGGLRVMWKYTRVHLYRMMTRNEIAEGDVVYHYGEY